MIGMSRQIVGPRMFGGPGRRDAGFRVVAVATDCHMEQCPRHSAGYASRGSRMDSDAGRWFRPRLRPRRRTGRCPDNSPTVDGIPAPAAHRHLHRATSRARADLTPIWFNP